MNKHELIFPEQVTVTDQVIDLAHVGEKARGIYVNETEMIYYEWINAHSRRRVVGFAGPSGVGKSVFVAVMKNLLLQIDSALNVTPLTIDAYHFRNSVLEERELIHHKGRYDTYDTVALARDLSAFCEGASVTFPNYSRTLHEPVSGRLCIATEIPALLLIEGLWLLCPEYGWESIMRRLDQKLFLDDSTELLRERTIARHIRGGRSKDDAVHFYDTSDSANNILVHATKQYAERIISIG